MSVIKATTPYLNRGLRTEAEFLAGKPPILFDDEPVDMRCRVPNCGSPLRMAQERAYKICMCCMKERA